MRTLSELGFIVLPLLCAGLILYGLHRVLASHYPPGKRRKILGVTVCILALWITLTAILAATGVVSDFSSFPPKLVFVLFPPLVFLLALTFTPGMKRLLLVVPPTWLLSMQVFRVAVELLLWLLFIQNLLPVQMTFEGRNFDVIAGLTAPCIAYLFTLQKPWSKVLAIGWNIACLGLLANIVVIAILSMPVPFRLFMNEPANTIVAQFPFVWLPAVLVPIAYSMHFFSLRQLLMRRA